MSLIALFSYIGKSEVGVNNVETYASLLAKNEVVQNDILEVDSQLRAAQDLAKQEKLAKKAEDEDAGEDLDAYMDKLKKGSAAG